MTVGEHLEICAQRLLEAGLCFGHGTDNAGDEAAWIIQSALGRSPLDDLGDMDLELDPKRARRIAEIIDERIRTRQPLAYVLGEAWFCGMRFEVNTGVLVPRSPFAELIEREFHPWLDAGTIKTALDLCTGSGCMAIAMGAYMPWLRVDAADISVEALVVARRNRTLHGMERQVALIESDLFDSITGRRYDLIVSNPPYVAADRYEQLPQEYRAEPQLGLISPGAGLGIPLRILAGAHEHLTPEGQLFCEVGETAEALQQMLPEVPFTWLEFEHGGEGVFTIGRSELIRHQAGLDEALERVRDVI